MPAKKKPSAAKSKTTTKRAASTKKSASSTKKTAGTTKGNSSSKKTPKSQSSAAKKKSPTRRAKATSKTSSAKKSAKSGTKPKGKVRNELVGDVDRNYLKDHGHLRSEIVEWISKHKISPIADQIWEDNLVRIYAQLESEGIVKEGTLRELFGVIGEHGIMSALISPQGEKPRKQKPLSEEEIDKLEKARTKQFETKFAGGTLTYPRPDSLGIPRDTGEKLAFRKADNPAALPIKDQLRRELSDRIEELPSKLDRYMAAEPHPVGRKSHETSQTSLVRELSSLADLANMIDTMPDDADRDPRCARNYDGQVHNARGSAKAAYYVPPRPKEPVPTTVKPFDGRGFLDD